MKTQTVGTCLSASSTHGILNKINNQNLKFWVVFQSFSNILFMGKFWQILIVFNSYEEIWVNFVALVVAKSNAQNLAKIFKTP
jgi:hypothetical protein